jgi:hypothetical protein
MDKPVYFIIEDIDPVDHDHPYRSSGYCQLAAFHALEDAEQYLEFLRRVRPGAFRIEERTS